MDRSRACQFIHVVFQRYLQSATYVRHYRVNDCVFDMQDSEQSFYPDVPSVCCFEFVHDRQRLPIPIACCVSGDPAVNENTHSGCKDDGLGFLNCIDGSVARGVE